MWLEGGSSSTNTIPTIISITTIIIIILIIIMILNVIPTPLSSLSTSSWVALLWSLHNPPTATIAVRGAPACPRRAPSPVRGAAEGPPAAGPSFGAVLQCHANAGNSWQEAMVTVMMLMTIVLISIDKKTTILTIIMMIATNALWTIINNNSNKLKI